jgi:hypothetical protein
MLEGISLYNTIQPSCNANMTSAYSSTIGSWVATRKVMPSRSTIWRKSEKIWRLVAVSSSPVGSSAKISSRRVARAREGQQVTRPVVRIAKGIAKAGGCHSIPIRAGIGHPGEVIVVQVPVVAGLHPDWGRDGSGDLGDESVVL